jgi:hypothetical protein
MLLGDVGAKNGRECPLVGDMGTQTGCFRRVGMVVDHLFLFIPDN